MVSRSPPIDPGYLRCALSVLCLAKLKHTVLASISDGSAMYGIDGLWIAAHLRLLMAYVVIVRSSRWLLDSGLEGDASI